MEKSLLRCHETDTAEARFVMLETIQEYAREQLEARGEADQLRAHHAAYAMALAEQAEREMVGPEQAAWLARLEAEHANMRAALTWARTTGRMLLALRLAAALGPFWTQRGYLSEGRQWLDSLGNMPAATAGREMHAARAKTLARAGTVAMAQSDYAQAAKWLDESLALYQDLGDTAGLATVLSSQGLAASEQGESARAELLLSKSLAMWRAVRSPTRGMATALVNLGGLAIAREDYAQADQLLREGLALSREIGHEGSVVAVLINLGEVARLQGDYVRAQALGTEGLTLARELGHKEYVAIALANLGDVAHLQGDDERARTFIAEALAVFSTVGNIRGSAYSLGTLAAVAGAMGQYRRAATLWGSAAALRTSVGVGLTPLEQAEQDTQLSHLQATLGREAFTSAWAEGQALTLEQAIALALDPPPPS
jgi:tetratricopeptide (TPR) repeat protein